QDEDTESGKLVVTSIKHVYVITGKSYTPGSFAPQSNANGSGEYAVRYWAIYENGEKVAEFDPLNGKCLIDGVDYLAPVKAALGK
ncbi:MAG: phage major tail tube protein, partial [Clostridia bacterium]|nr:phage major tail tube protein [Clostridia bacterium]